MRVDALAGGIFRHRPLFFAAAAPAGIVLSTFASSADANRAKPAGEFPVPFDAKSTPPSISLARWPEPAKLNVTLFPPLARRNEVLCHEVERRLGVRRGEEGRGGRLGRRRAGTDPGHGRGDREDQPCCAHEPGD